MAIAHNTAIDEKLTEYKKQKTVVVQKIIQRLYALQTYFMCHDANLEGVVTTLKENGGIHKKRVSKNHRRYKVPHGLSEAEQSEHVLRQRIQKLKGYILNGGKNTKGEDIFTDDEISILQGTGEPHVNIPPAPKARKAEKSVIHAEQYLLYRLFNNGQTPLSKDEVIGISRPLCGVCYKTFSRINQNLKLMAENNGQFLVGSSHQARNAYTSIPQPIKEEVSKDPTPFGAVDQLHSESGSSCESGEEVSDGELEPENDEHDTDPGADSGDGSAGPELPTCGFGTGAGCPGCDECPELKNYGGYEADGEVDDCNDEPSAKYVTR